MTPNEEKAVVAHGTGLNCAQSVVTTYADVLHVDADLAKSIAAGFGSGMGRLQETCGAVTGAFMVLGIHATQRYPTLTEQKSQAAAMVREFNKRFTDIHGTNTCRQLLGCDMNTEEGREYHKTNNLSATVCDRCIADAARIVDELIP